MGLFSSIGSMFGGPTGSIVGSIFDKRQEDKRYNQQRNDQIEAAQNSITWRVADAKRAGIHPLAALGLPLTNISPIVTGAESGSFEKIGKQLGQYFQKHSPREREAESIAYANLQTNRDIKLAQLKNIQLKNFEQKLENEKAWKKHIGSPSTGTQIVDDKIIQPRQGKKYIGAGTHSAWREYYWGPGQKLLLPFNEEGPSEAIQSMPKWLIPKVIEMNTREYGPNGQWRKFLPSSWFKIK